MQVSLDMFVGTASQKPTTTTRTTTVYYGQVPCRGKTKEGKKCQNKAYYEWQGSYYCGSHCRPSKCGDRKTLPKDPDAALNRRRELLLWHREVEEVALAKQAVGTHGHVVVGKLRMVKSPPHLPGYLAVFPNYRHGERVDGFGCSSLSPKSMGPVDHGMPGIPIALNLENYHQGAKIFSNEVKVRSGNEQELDSSPFRWQILPEAIELRKHMYADPVPHRHKFDYPQMKRLVAKSGGIHDATGGDNVNRPLFSVFYHLKTGKERRYAYLQARFFYCYWYEQLSWGNTELEALRTKIRNGYNLHILGYDGRPVVRRNKNEGMINCLYRYYLNKEQPFGHELVLFSLLVLGRRSHHYPWNRFRRNCPGLYEGYVP
jgi:hypothetical protein